MRNIVSRHEVLEVIFDEFPSRFEEELYFAVKHLSFGWIVSENGCCTICFESVG